jgi:hypothetical protein
MEEPVAGRWIIECDIWRHGIFSGDFMVESQLSRTFESKQLSPLRDRKVRVRQDTSLKVPINEVMGEARANGLCVQRLTGYGKVLDARLLGVEGRICQIIRTRQVIDAHYPKTAYAPLYLPRNEFADFLVYVAFPDSSSTPPRFYVVPRGVMTKDTAWSLESLEQYRDAWQVFKQPVNPELTERHFTVLNWQLRAIIDAAKDAALDVTLIGRKRHVRWPTFVQRRAIVNGRKCAVYSCTRLSCDPTAPRHNCIFLRTPTNKWAEFQLCIVKDGPSEYQIYVIPCGAIQKQTTASLDNPDLQSYKSNWKLLSVSASEPAKIAPIEWRPKKARPQRKFPEALTQTMEHHKSDGRRKHRHFAAKIVYTDGAAFVRVYTDRDKADAFAARQCKSPVVKMVRVTEAD